MKKLIVSFFAIFIIISVTACTGFNNIEKGKTNSTNLEKNKHPQKKEELTIDYLKTLPASDVSNFEYEVIEEMMTITKYIGEEEIVIIPDTIDGQPVAKIGDDAFINQEEIKAVKLSDSVISIGHHAFENCYDLEVFVCGSSLKTIGVYAFNYCTSLSQVELNEGLKELQLCCLTNTMIERIYIPSSVELIEIAFLPKSEIEQFVIEGEAGSVAEQYANNSGFVFEAK